VHRRCGWWAVARRGARCVELTEKVRHYFPSGGRNPARIEFCRHRSIHCTSTRSARLLALPVPNMNHSAGLR